MSTIDDEAGSRFGFLGGEVVVSLGSFVAFLALWGIVSHVYGLEDVVSSPFLVGADTYELLLSGEWVPHMLATLRRILYAFGFSMVLGTIVGVGMGLSDFWEKLFQDYVIVSMSMPGLFAVVFTAMYFGVSDITPMIAAGIVVFGFCALMIFEGVRDIDHRYIEMARAFDVPRRRVIRRVMVPDVLGEWFAAARYSFGVSWKVVVLAEFIAAQSGIGYQIHERMATLQLTGVLTWTVVFLAVMVIWEYGVLRYIERRIFAWRDGGDILGF